MADPNQIVSLKRHSHPVLLMLSIVAVALSSVALVKSCPPTPAPASTAVPVEEKPLAAVSVEAAPVAPVPDIEHPDAPAPAGDAIAPVTP
jgi:hypothetical protein